MSDDDLLTNIARPNTSATLTIRIIKSFIFRTERNLVLHDINLATTTVAQLKEIAKQSMFDYIQFFGIMTAHMIVRCGHSTRLETVPKCCSRFILLECLFRSLDINEFCWADTLKLYTKAHGAKVFFLWIRVVTFHGYYFRHLISSLISIMTTGY